MKILAIETSCDETAITYLEAVETEDGIHFFVLGNQIHSQVDLHQEFGGVFPALAKREHIKNLPIVLDQVLQGEKNPEVDYICVTNGPGLEPALWCGIVFAKELGKKWNVPVIPVNHMEGHILSVLVPKISLTEQTEFTIKKDSLEFPALALLISGGHTELILVNQIGDYTLIGKTKDDAVGEAFDKVARILGLPYPGGPEISRLAQGHKAEGNLATPNFPRPMLHTKDLDFSFSGLKTAVLYYVRDLGRELTDDDKSVIAYEFQEAVAEVVTKKTFSACDEYTIQTLIVGGGVAANTRIQESLLEKISEIIPSENILFPARELTGDNALMIALAGYFKIKKSPDAIYTDIQASGNLGF